MKSSPLPFLLIVFSMLTISASALTGGPDAYGYVWEDSNEPGGPAYSWVDITTTGTLVSGLADDNSVGMFPMGMSFHYYWGDYTQIKIGSNGWIGFENISNIASCFPSIPTAGGAGDTYLTALMADWNFDGAGNQGEVYYEFDATGDRFIISYINVSRWVATAPNYSGSSSFQVILNNSDSSIVFQYQTMDPVFNTGCVANTVIGIEGPTGAYGLQHSTNTIPVAGYAIKFTYPDPVLLSVPDIKANWNVNNLNKGDFRYIGDDVDVPINIASVGNVDVTTPISVLTEIRDQGSVLIASNAFTIASGLPFGTDSTTQFQWVPTAAGQFSVTTTITNASDINTTNNIRVTEFEIIDPTLLASRYNYVNATDVSTGTLSWSGGGGGDDGAGTLIIPNVYPFAIESVAGFMEGIPEDLIFEVYANDGVGGLPGTLLHAETIPAAIVSTTTWTSSTPASPIIIDSGGVYIVWIQFGANMQLGTNGTVALSNRNFEYLGGSWAEYRDNSVADFMLELNGFAVCSNFALVVDSTQDVDCFGGSNGAANVTASGGAGYAFDWSGGIGAVEDPTNLSAGVYTVTVSDSNGCSQTDSVTINEPTQLMLTATTIDEVLGADGEIDLTVTGGIAPYSYSWTGGAGTVEDPTALSGGDYTVTVTDSNGCTETLLVTVDSQVGIDEHFLQSQWSIFPNPSNGVFTISVDSEIEATRIEIIDILGKQIYLNESDKLNSISIDKSGVYMVVLYTANGKSVKKIIVG